MQVGVLIWELFLEGCWHHFYWIFTTTWHGRSSKLYWKKQWFFNVFQFLVVVLLGWFVDWFLIDFWLIWGSKIDQKSIKNRAKKLSKIRCDLGSIFESSWVGFGVDLGAKLGPSWGQVGTKLGWKSIKNDVKKRMKKDCILKASWSEFGSIVGSKNQPCGAKLGAKSIQDWSWFESCFWKDFGIIFSSILYTT